jgi:ribosomal protein L17
MYCRSVEVSLIKHESHVFKNMTVELRRMVDRIILELDVDDVHNQQQKQSLQ